MGSMLLYLHVIVLVGLHVFVGRSGDVSVSPLGLAGGGDVTTSSLSCSVCTVAEDCRAIWFCLLLFVGFIWARFGSFVCNGVLI
ncbi:hypothetical protein RchiOBHm_Chr2g0156151 [Rosa chinensis]|uniref:Secreted peptide n=1 Tax=Rosa chinensis TaxID=74649 RepID=A0A2P6S1E6_ROSCH|nr:hypothetical protein RchiOBHm_Chr2g0156151 [Rosa chinensis]